MRNSFPKPATDSQAPSHGIRRAIPFWLLLGSGLIALSAIPDKQVAKPAPSSPPAAPQVIRNWNFTLKKDGHTQGEFRGETARIVARGEFDVAGFRVTTFRPDGEADLTAESPACRVTLTPNGFLVTSTGALQLSQADSRFGLTGEGFRWDHGAQRLVVSNKVQSFLLLTLPRPTTPPGS